LYADCAVTPISHQQNIFQLHNFSSPRCRSDVAAFFAGFFPSIGRKSWSFKLGLDIDEDGDAEVGVATMGNAA
jgi:hypothetical protein